jgi:signal transduction histidine kinase
MAQLEPNTDLWGMDFRDFVVPENPRACLAACRAAPRCRAFTFRSAAVAYGRPHCWLKSDIPPARYAQGATSGIVRPEEVSARPSGFELNTDSRGSDFRISVGQYSHDSWKVLEGFTSSRTNSIAQTPDGYLWVGTDDSRDVAAGPGLYRFDGDKNIRWEPPPGQQLPSNLVSSLLAARDGTLWIGTSTGLASWKLGKLTRYDGLAGFFIFRMLEDRDGTIWVSGIGTPTGRLCAIEPSRVHCYGDDGNLGIGVTALYEDRKGNLWAAVVNGFWRWKPGPPDFYSMAGTLDGIRDFIETEDGGLLFTTRSGVKRLRNGKIEPYSFPGDLQQLRVMRMLRDRDGGIWLGTWDRGILHVHQGSTESYSVGLSGVDIAALLEDHEGDIWAVTSEGLDRFRIPNTKGRTTPVLIEQIKVDGKTYHATNGLRLPPHVRDLAIDYTVPTLIAPENIQFRYKLEGQDPNWREAANVRQVQYSNLAPRNYRFRVMARNNDGAWDEAGAFVDFSILPAYYQTTWFLVCCAAGFLLLLWALYRIRVRQIAKAINARFDERLAERTRIARDLHDTFLQTIQGSKLVADSALKQSSDLSRMHGALEQLSIWLGRATEEGREALNSLRTSTTEKNDLAEAFRRAIKECRVGNSMETSFSVVGDTREMHPIVRDEVYRIGYEAIRNACAHSQANKLQVTLTYGDELGVRVSDNGVGIDPLVADRGKDGHFGLQGMRERAARIAGKLTVTGSPASGTDVKLVVPGKIIYRKTTSDSEHSKVKR